MGVFKPIVGITMGDPAGIGPEIIIKALKDQSCIRGFIPVVLGDAGVLQKATRLIEDPPEVKKVSDVPEAWQPGTVPVLQGTRQDLKGVRWGRLDERSGRAQFDFISMAVSLALQGRIHAVVTCPINKQGLKMAQIPFPGHTEILASMTGSEKVAMMLVGPKLKVVPATLHMALSEVSGALSLELIQQTVQLTDLALRGMFSIAEPRIGVCGLNPHAGDGGLFGKEEAEVIAPAIGSCLREGIVVEGPLSPDSAFIAASEGRYDAVVAMYHDQGLIPIKLLHRGQSVNLTLGLPIIRTSVDHGTAYDISGKGIALPNSLIAAMKLASTLAGNRATS